MRYLMPHQRHLRRPKAPTPLSGLGIDTAMAGVGILALHPKVHGHVPNNHLASTLTYMAGALGYAIFAPVVNDFAASYMISASGRGKTPFADPAIPSKVVLLRDAAAGHVDVDSPFAAITYASSINAGTAVYAGGFNDGGASQSSSSSGAEGDFTSRNAQNSNQDSNGDGLTPPDGGRPRRSSRLANVKIRHAELPSLYNRRNKARGGPPPPPPPGGGTALGIDDGSKGNDKYISGFTLGLILFAVFVISVSIKLFKCRGYKEKKERLTTSKYILASNPVCMPFEISNSTSSSLDKLGPGLSTSTSGMKVAVCGLVPDVIYAYCSNLAPVLLRLPSRLGIAVRALVSATAHSVSPLNRTLPAADLHFSRDSLITEACHGAYNGGFTNTSMQWVMQFGSSHYVGVLQQTARYLRKVLLSVSVIILATCLDHLVWTLLPLVQDGARFSEQPVSDPPPPAMEWAILDVSPLRGATVIIRTTGEIRVTRGNASETVGQQPIPNTGNTRVEVDVIQERKSAIEVLEQIIPGPTTVVGETNEVSVTEAVWAAPENVAELDASIASILTDLPLKNDDGDVFVYPGFVAEPAQAEDSEVFIYPGFVDDVDVRHEQADDTDVFVYQGDSNINDDHKDDSEVFVYPGVVDSVEPVVSNDVFGEVKDVKVGSNTEILCPPLEDIGASIHAPQNSISPDTPDDIAQNDTVDKGKRKANFDIEDGTADGPKNVIVAVGGNTDTSDPTAPVFVAMPGHRRHRTRPKQRRKKWLERQAAAEGAQTIA